MLFWLFFCSSAYDMAFVELIGFYAPFFMEWDWFFFLFFLLLTSEESESLELDLLPEEEEPDDEEEECEEDEALIFFFYLEVLAISLYCFTTCLCFLLGIDLICD